MSNIHPFPALKKSPYVFGGHIDSAKVCLRLFGDDLIPNSISEILGAKPDIACLKGETRITQSGTVVEKTGKWILNGSLPENTPLERQIQSLLHKVTDDLDAWHELARRYRVEIFCGVFLEAFNRGFVLSTQLIDQLAKRKLQLNMDLYSHFE